MYDDLSSKLQRWTENYIILNYEPGNAKESFGGDTHGKGTIYYKNGQKLIGNFKSGKIDGSAKLVSANGDILRSGTFRGWAGLYFVEEEVKILSGKISEKNFTAEGKLYFSSNKVYSGTFRYSWPGVQLIGVGQLIDDNGKKIEDGICSLNHFTNILEGVEWHYGIYFGKEKTGTVSGKIHLSSGKTYQGEFENRKKSYEYKYFVPTEGTLFSYDGRVIQKGKWEDGKFVG